MQWYYAEAGRQCGPVATEQLDEFVRSGKILPTNLVWREGMPDWKPYAALQPPAPPSQSVGGTATGRCVECGQTFSTNDMLLYEKSWVCARCKPTFFQRVKEGAAPPAGLRLWRSDRLLVMSREATLPDRCVKCNAPAHGQRLRRNLYWHSSYLYLLLLLNLLIYLIVAIIVRKRAKVEIGLCDSHRHQRWLAITLAWFGFLGGIGMLIAGAANDWPVLGLLGLPILLGGLVIGAIKGPVISS